MENKMKKPRICEVLGVDVGESFGFKVYSHVNTFCVNDEGEVVYKCGTYPNSSTLSYIINNPDLIIKRKRLTKNELDICKLLGAKWVCKDSDGKRKHIVSLWKLKPVCSNGEFKESAFISGSFILADIREELFPSVNNGDLIFVDDAKPD